MAEPTPSSSPQQTSPDYAGLVRFLIEPLLEFPEALSINCERANGSKRVWIRVAFEETDRGRVWGRGGRNIQAIRTLLDAAARGVGQSVYLDIYGSPEDQQHSEDDNEGDSAPKSDRKRPRPRRSPSKPALRSRSR
ncbi:MAG: KH domain-containing protein [Cyanobacteriota bacterium]|nr:KH domain-containing protein [Cyanobacteriota bacterium]